MAFRPSFQASMYASCTSSMVASGGRFTVFEMAPEMNGCTADIMRMCPRAWIDRVPLAARNAQSKTGRCSSFSPGAPSIVSS